MSQGVPEPAPGRRRASRAGFAAAVWATFLLLGLAGCSGSGTLSTIATVAVQVDVSVQTASLAVQQRADDVTFSSVTETTLEDAISEVDDARTQLGATAADERQEIDAKREVEAVLDEASTVLDEARTGVRGGGDLEVTVDALRQMAERTQALRERWEPLS